jgi:hypothetical protein
MVSGCLVPETARSSVSVQSKVSLEEKVQTIHHQLMGPVVASHPKRINLNLHTPGHSAVAAGIYVQNLRTVPLACVSYTQNYTGRKKHMTTQIKIGLQ